MSQLTLLDLVAEAGLIAAKGFVSNGFVALPPPRLDLDSSLLAGMVDKYSDPNFGQPIHVLTELPELYSGFPASIVLGPADQPPPYDSLDGLYLVDADYLDLILDSSRDDDQTITYRGYVENSQHSGGICPIVAVYTDDKLVGFVACLFAGQSQEEVTVALAAKFEEK